MVIHPSTGALDHAPYDEDVAASGSDDPFGNAAKQSLCEPRSAVRTKNDELSALALGLTQDHESWITMPNDRPEPKPSGAHARDHLAQGRSRRGFVFVAQLDARSL
ncbi:MAG: hypothetical protein IT381_19395 [Deltaproteobacteria bacterium]|nr:hypothetical protein [Deltaproteobacteria bacterium]